MKKLTFKSCLRYLTFLFFVSSATANASEFSIGLATPSPTGVTAKLWTSPTTAYDIFAEWNFSSSNYNVHADYLTHYYDTFNFKESNMLFYSGFGIRAVYDSTEDESATVGARVPFGISYLMENPDIDFFGEVAPRMDVAPHTNFGLDVMIGLRYRIGNAQQ